MMHPPQGTLDLLTVLKAAYPVGSIYISVVSTSPATLFGFGTWAAFGAGCCLVGLDSGDADFNTAEETGGEKTHQLTTTEMPAHTHDLNSGENSLVDAGGALEGAGGTSGYWLFDLVPLITATQSRGGDGAHNNLQPYIVVYMWKRTA